jgi:hypothetical protein
MDPLVRENEALHMLLADACATLYAYAQLGDEGKAAQDCLDRITAGEPMAPFAEDISQL